MQERLFFIRHKNKNIRANLMLKINKMNLFIIQLISWVQDQFEFERFA